MTPAERWAQALSHARSALEELAEIDTLSIAEVADLGDEGDCDVDAIADLCKEISRQLLTHLHTAIATEDT